MTPQVKQMRQAKQQQMANHSMYASFEFKPNRGYNVNYMLANIKKMDKYSDPIQAFERLRETLD